MSTYYKKIDGKNYDKAMLDIAGKSIKGKGDGRISLADARNIVKQISDGGKITDIEKRTLNYILEKYTLTETALKHIEKSLSDNLDADLKREIKSEKSAAVKEIAVEEKPDAVQGKKSNKLIIIFLLLLILFAAVFFIFKYFYRSTVKDKTQSENREELTAPVKEESVEADSEKTIPVPENEKAVTAEKPAAENEYIVKEKDTLIRISEALYGDYTKWEEIYRLNKGKISKPSILYPGQVLIIPDKTDIKDDKQVIQQKYKSDSAD